MSEHFSEHELEIYYLSPEELGESETEKILLHLGKCQLCNGHLREVKQYYQSLEESPESTPTERDTAFARKLLSRNRLFLPGRKAELKEKSDSLVESFAEVIEPYRSSLTERFIRYLRIHPVRSAGVFSFAALALAAAFMSIRPKLDKNPAIAQAKDGFLIVQNGHGDELWRKHIGDKFTMEGAPPYIGGHPERVINLKDLDSDGTNELFCIFGWTSMDFPFNNLLICYNADSTERWKYELHRTMQFGGVPYSDQYKFYHIEAGDFAHSGDIEIIAAATHDPWAPNVLLRLDGKGGKLISEFWHPGMLREFGHKDLNHDGVEELVYGGQNNRLQQACVVVFDPRSVEGSAPAPQGYYPNGFPQGTEKYYITFPGSDLKQFATDVTNEVTGLRIAGDGTLEVMVNEPVRIATGTLYYYFDSQLNCINVRASDSFTAAHQQLERDGKLATHLNDEYFEALRKGVTYWDGEKFVNHLTMNPEDNSAFLLESFTG
ncbi:MAG: hypothetical protein E6K56_06560 [Ignavibacteria bacterium]|nr:MAG: hypothetical protein E6K56_06560 [Ignavibacteria bacterium]